MAWKFDQSTAIYLQLMERIKLGIVSGETGPGEKLPSVRELSAQAGVNPNTMQRALTELEREGLIYPIRTTGRFVTESAEHIARLRRQTAREKIDGFLSDMRKIGYRKEEILEMLQEKPEAEKGGELFE